MIRLQTQVIGLVKKKFKTSNPYKFDQTVFDTKDKFKAHSSHGDSCLELSVDVITLLKKQCCPGKKESAVDNQMLPNILFAAQLTDVLN